MADIDFKSCPIGIKNEAEIRNTNDRMGLIMQRLEEKLDDVKISITSIDSRLDVMENKIEDIQSSLPSVIDEEIKRHNNKNAMSIIRWVVVTLCGSVTITVLGKMILAAMQL